LDQFIPEKGMVKHTHDVAKLKAYTRNEMPTINKEDMAGDSFFSHRNIDLIVD
jgi:hypothetical protein